MATSLNLKKFTFLKQSEHLEIIIDYNNTVKVSFLNKGNFMGLGQLHQDDIYIYSCLSIHVYF